MENLAPAGNRAALERAEAAGADAVYLGYSLFSARAGAGNFDREQLTQAIRYVHLRHMRVYVAVNTLVKDSELPDLREVLRLLSDLRADAILIQDLGILRICLEEFPQLRLHASTQMAIHNASGVRFCRRMGMERVVLARECSLSEIRRCSREGIEIEVFAHGAQCVSVSGLCLFSSMVGGRSGNRGRCAQPCRQRYSFDGKWGSWLSPRDVCLRNDLSALQEAGVSSVKLEGRLKRPEYTGVVTSSYRKGLDQLEEGRPEAADPEEMDGLKQIFHRGGFMRGYAFGDEDAAVIDPSQVNHSGLEMGRILAVDGRLARMRTIRPLHNGDGLLIRSGREGSEMIYAGPDCSAGDEAILRIREGETVRSGDTVFRLTDVLQMKSVNAMPGRKVPVSMFLRAVPGSLLSLRVSDGISTVCMDGEQVAQARTRAAAPEELIRSLSRTGDTVFVPESVRVETEQAFVPISALNDLRRRALLQLEEERLSAFELPHDPKPLRMKPLEMQESAEREEGCPGAAPTAVIRTSEQADRARKAGFRVVWYPEDFRQEALELLLEKMPEGDWLRLPDVCEEDTLRMIHQLVTSCADRLGGVMLGTVGQLGLSWPVPAAAGSGIPVMNTEAARFLMNQGLCFATVSQELSHQEMAALTESGLPLLLPKYGRTQLMLLHHCPARTALGLHAGHRDCTLCDRKDSRSLRGKELTDQHGYSFPLLRQRLPEGCLVRLLNTLPTEWPGQGNGLPSLIELTVENEEETERVLRGLREHHRSGLSVTSGHWNRPVE